MVMALGALTAVDRLHRRSWNLRSNPGHRSNHWRQTPFTVLGDSAGRGVCCGLRRTPKLCRPRAQDAVSTTDNLRAVGTSAVFALESKTMP